MDPTADALLRVLPVALRGASGNLVTFDAGGVLHISKEVPLPLASAFMLVCTPGLYFRGIREILDTSQRYSSLFLQSVLCASHRTVEAYLGVVQQVEDEVVSDRATLASVHAMLLEPTWYLRATLSILREIRQTANVAEAVCLNVVFRYTKNGDPVIAKHAKMMFNEVYATFDTLLNSWTNHGSLELDVFQEFFVRRAPREKQPLSEAEEHQFELLEHRIPDCLPRWRAVDAFEKGKALYFIRTVCEEHLYDGTGRTCEEVCTHAYDLLVEKFQLHLHLRGLRDYMFLTNGDYTDGLFRNDTRLFMLGTLAGTRPVDIGSYLLGAFDDLRGSLKEDPRVFSQIDGKIMSVEDPRTKSNWESFVCCYYMPSLPLSLIIDDDAILKYERCFAVLFRIRFSFHYLTYAKSLLQYLYHQRSPESAAIVDIMKILRSMYVPMAEMQQAFYYEKVGAIWSRFQKRISANSKLTLKDIKQEHTEYLDAIVNAVALPEIFSSVDCAAHCVFKFLQLVLDLQADRISAEDVYAEVATLPDDFLLAVNEVPLHSERLYDASAPLKEQASGVNMPVSPLR